MSRCGRIVLFAGVALGLAGCGPETPVHDKAADYTADSLAQELLFRYRALSPSGKVRRPASSNAKTKVLKGETGKSAVDETSKKAVSRTIDDLAEETVAKMLLIKDHPRAETLKSVEAAVTSDAALDAKDKTLVIEALDAAASAAK